MHWMPGEIVSLRLSIRINQKCVVLCWQLWLLHYPELRLTCIFCKTELRVRSRVLRKCHDTCHVPGLAPIFLFSFTITSQSFPPVCALEGLLFCDVISLTHIRVPLLSPMTVILGLTHPSSLIYDMTSSSLTRCILSCLWFILSYLALDPPYSSPFSETRWTLYFLWFVDSYLWPVPMTRPFDSDSSWPLTHTVQALRI